MTRPPRSHKDRRSGQARKEDKLLLGKQRKRSRRPAVSGSFSVPERRQAVSAL